MAAFLDVILRGLALAGQAVAIGGVLFVLLVYRGLEAPRRVWTLVAAGAAVLLRRFSALAIVAVGTLLAAGIGLTLGYVDSVRGMVGTAYGLMVLTKAVMLGLLLVFGAVNFFVVRRLPPDDAAAPVRLRRY